MTRTIAVLVQHNQYLLEIVNYRVIGGASCIMSMLDSLLTVYIENVKKFSNNTSKL